MRFPSRDSPITVRPAAAESGGSTERSTKGLPSRTRSSRAPRTRASSASMYAVTSGNSGMIGVRARGSGPAAAVVMCPDDTMMSESGTPARGPVPPAARVIPRIDTVHGDRRVDDYFWLREKDNPEVQAYLDAENAYAAAVMQPTAALADAHYSEMLARIKEDNQSVPYRRGGHFYYARTEKGKQYAIHCRKAGGLDAAEEVMLDENALAEGHPFFALGMWTVSDDGALLAYTTDVTGFREYTLSVKDLRSGERLPDRIEKVVSVAWAADGRTLFYVTEDAAKRPYRLYRHRLGAASDDLLYEETDAMFNLGVERTRSRRYLLAVSASFTTTEVRYLPADRPGDPWALLLSREQDHEYHVDHWSSGDDDGVFYIRTNGGGRRNFRLVTAPVADPRPEQWVEQIAHRDDVMLEDVEVFRAHV